MRIDIIEDEDGETVKLLVLEDADEAISFRVNPHNPKEISLVITDDMEQLISNEHYEY
tara:strand:+ start:289 stop:462 length:174 start_codon:yes stop_codon:yes gene_type:complete